MSCMQTVQATARIFARQSRLAYLFIQGIYAVGTRTTTVIPDDTPGPDVVEVVETWVSPDLGITVLVKKSSTDPRSDQTMVEMRKLDRVEPDAALFEVPAQCARSRCFCEAGRS